MGQLAVIFGGPSPEHDVSVLTGLQAARELSRAGHDLVALYWSRNGEWFSVDPSLEGKDFADTVPKGSKSLQLVAQHGGGFVSNKGTILGKQTLLHVDVALNCCHGGPGEDGSLQATLDLAGIRYTGPTGVSAALSMDKLAFGSLAVAAGLQSLPRTALRHGEPHFSGPYIVKPRFGGSSIGIEIVEDADTAEALLTSSVHLRSGAVIEPYKPELFDLNVAVRNFPNFQMSAIEKPVRSANSEGILGYADKYVGQEGMASAPRELPANINSTVAKVIQDAARQLAALVPVRGIARIDFLSDGNSVYVNEINPIPGSMSKYLWVDPAIAFINLLEDLIEEAITRPASHHHASGADGRALRSAGSINAKLG